MRLNLITLFLLFSLTAFSKEKLSSLDQALMMSDWGGAPAFIKNVQQEKKEICAYLSDVEKRFKDNTFVARRVLLTLAQTDCAQKKSVVEKHIATKEVVLLSTVIDTATTLPMNDKRLMKKKIQKIKEKDPLVKESVERFISSIK